MKLKPLLPGDRIAIVAPSSPFDNEKLSSACEMLENRGFRVSTGKHVRNRRGYLAGTESERAEDLMHAILSPDVAAVFCVRGGYGSGRLLPWLPFSLFRDKPKIFLGHSDVTFLHLAFRTHVGWPTLHGPNAIAMAEFGDRFENTLLALSGKREFRWEFLQPQVLRHGRAAGPVIGGNLTCLVHLLGTPHFPDPSGAILFVEDRGEALYRLDRMFAQLKLAGILERLAGLILGSFTECGEVPSVWDMVMEHVAAFSYPVI
ncbi:MAG: LD-carboxypeptidase, partial [Syntrophobacteraceae bacterium]